MYARLGFYLQMVAAFLLLTLTHYFASAFLPIADCDETFNFIEPVHFLLYGSGKQTWELCPQFALRSWLFSWMYAWPAVFIRGAASLSSADVYFYLRIFNGRIAALAELFFVYSVWSAFSGKAAMVALILLLVNYPIPHAAVSVLPTSFVMICNFVVLGCWLRTRDWTAAAFRSVKSEKRERSTAALVSRAPTRVLWCVGVALFFSVFGGVTGWPFAGLVSAPIGLDLLLRFSRHTVVFMIAAACVVVAAGVAMDARYYCRWTLSGWNVVLYNVFGGADRGPDIFDVEPWFFFWKNLTLNFHLLFVAVLLAPLVVLCSPRRASLSCTADAAAASTPLMASPTTASRGAREFASATEPLRRFASSDEVRPLLAHQSGSPTSPLIRARLHAGDTPERRSSLISSRHPHLLSTAVAAAAHGPALVVSGGCSRGRELLYMTPFFVWFVFWMCIAHKEERFMSPAYPFMVLAATRAICLVFFADGEDGEDARGSSSGGTSGGGSGSGEGVSNSTADTAVAPAAATAAASQRAASRPAHAAGAPTAMALRRYAGFAAVLLFFLLSYSRAMAVYTYYSGPERVFYDWYPMLRAEAQRRWAEKATLAMAAAADGTADPSVPPVMRGTTPQQTNELNTYYTVCLGREWYRFPSSFFLDHRWARYQFLNTTAFHGILPVSFVTANAGYEQGLLFSGPLAESSAAANRADQNARGACTCGARSVNDLNREITEQYVQHPTVECDAIFDSLSPPTHVSAEQHSAELRSRHLDTIFTRSLLNTTALRAVLAAEGEPYHAMDEAYAVMDVDRTPLWCRVLYYPFGISKRCAVWRPLVLNARA